MPALAAAALALDALTAALARVTPERAVQFDAIPVHAAIAARAWLAEYPKSRGVPWNLRGDLCREKRARRCERIRDARRGWQLDAP